MKLFQRLSRLSTRRLLGLSLLFNLPFAILQIHRVAFDTDVHIFLADHYRRSWFNLWEPRWYLGFSTASYPPLIHQLIALLSWPAEALVRAFSAIPEQYAGQWRWLGEEAGFVLVLLGVLAAFPLAVRAFARVFVGPRAATLAGLLAIILPGLSLVTWSFGQLPSTAATCLALGALSRGHAFLRWGRKRHLAQAVALAAVTAATHHGVFLMVPCAAAAVTAQAVLLERRQSRRWPLAVFGRLALWGGAAGLAAAAMLWPFLDWSAGQTLQTPIDHLSRHNLLLDFAASGFFFWPVYGPLLLALPWMGRAAVRVRGHRAAPAAALGLVLLILGLGGTTPLPRLLFGEGWAWLTYERFAFWAAAALLPLAGAFTLFLARRRPRWAGALAGSLTLAAAVAALLSTLARAQPPAVALGPIVNFLNQPENRPYRYFTLGFGDQLARLSAIALNGTPDGTYHTARELPELRASGIGAIDTVMWSSTPAAAYPFLVRAEAYGVRWAFVAHPHYEAVLRAAGWVYRYHVGTVQLWEKPGVTPVTVAAPLGLDRSPAALWWGLAPLAALLMAALVLAEPWDWRARRRWWSRPRLAELAGTLRLWGWGLTLALATLWWHHTLYVGSTDWVYFIYQNVMVFASDVAAVGVIAAWVVERGLRGGGVCLGPRGLWMGLAGLIAASTLSLAQSTAPVVTLGVILHLVMLAAWYVMLVNDPPTPRQAGAVIVGIAAVQGLIALAEALTQTTAWLGRLGLPWPGTVTAEMSGASVVQVANGRRWLRAYGTLSHPNILGGYLLAGLALAWERLRATRRRVWWLTGGLLAAALVLTFSRSASLGAGVLVATAALLWLPPWKAGAHWAGVRRWGAAGVLGLALVSVPVLPVLAARSGLGQGGSALEERSLQDRVRLGLAAGRMFLERPLTGVGAGAFVVGLYQRTGMDLALEPAHNLPLLLSAEMGVPGLAAMLLLAGAIGWRLWQRRRVAELSEGLLGAALVGMLAVGLFDHYWWSMPPARLWWMTVLGLWAGYSARKPDSVR